ncbi:MAG: hypothetical protein QNJ54_07895 [Prochloraceae cyanobacterium]|nr:hypothetical protein [Prochloraceae cyanobacterium]
MSIQIEAKKQTRLLLNLWNLGGIEKEVKLGELNKQVKLNKEKAKDYQKIYDRLEKEEAIALTKKGNSTKVSLTNKGLQMLDAGIKSPDFKYKPTQKVRTKDFNALLKWIEHLDIAVSPNNPNNGNTNGKQSEIVSYEEFKQVALDVYEKLNKGYNYDDLVPIYRIRREIGEKVDRIQFNEWLLEMQANDIFQLMEGSVEDSAPDKIEDSITTELSGLRCYAKRLVA